MLVLLEALMRERRQRIQGEHREHGPEQEHLVGLGIAPGEGKAQAAVAGVRHAKAQGTHQQQRKHHRQRQAQRQCQEQGDMAGKLEHHRQAKHDGAALEDGGGTAVVIEARAVQPRVAVEVLHRADLGPGRVDAQRDNGQQGIDDPDAEKLGARADELEPQRTHRRGRLLVCRRVERIVV